MAKKLYVGVGDFAKQAVDILIGVNGTAKKAKKIYIGDENGIAKLVYDNTPVALVIRPYAAYGKDYPSGSWDSSISNYGYIERYSYSNQIRNVCYTNKQLICYHELLFRFADGREASVNHFCHDQNTNAVISTTDYISYNGGSGSGGWNATISGLGGLRPDNWGTKTATSTLSKTVTTTELYVTGTTYGTFLYLSSYSTGLYNIYNYFTFNSCTINGVSIPIIVES